MRDRVQIHSNIQGLADICELFSKKGLLAQSYFGEVYGYAGKQILARAIKMEKENWR